MSRRSEAYRWSRDEDGWLFRPRLARDNALPATGNYIADGCDAFFEEGKLYCRNARQRRRLDISLRPCAPSLMKGEVNRG